MKKHLLTITLALLLLITCHASYGVGIDLKVENVPVIDKPTLTALADGTARYRNIETLVAQDPSIDIDSLIGDWKSGFIFISIPSPSLNVERKREASAIDWGYKKGSSRTIEDSRVIDLLSTLIDTQGIDTCPQLQQAYVRALMRDRSKPLPENLTDYIPFENIRSNYKRAIESAKRRKMLKDYEVRWESIFTDLKAHSAAIKSGKDGNPGFSSRLREHEKYSAQVAEFSMATSGRPKQKTEESEADRIFRETVLSRPDGAEILGDIDADQSWREQARQDLTRRLKGDSVEKKG